MVLIHVKNSEQEQFLFEASVQDLVEDTVKALVDVYNLRHKIQRLKLEGGELVKYGPAKPLDKQGIDTYSEAAVEKGRFYNMDPTGRRTGNACDPDVGKKLLQELDSAEALASKDQAAKKVVLTAALLREAVDRVRGAVMICYPMGLPEYDFIREALEDREDMAGSNFGGLDLPPESSALWFAGKALEPGAKLADYMGRNERSKVVVKLQKKGAGAPAREPAVDADTQKAMLAWYHKRQEQQKALEADDTDAHTHSSWADSQSLKRHFAGVASVRVPR